MFDTCPSLRYDRSHDAGQPGGQPGRPRAILITTTKQMFVIKMAPAARLPVGCISVGCENQIKWRSSSANKRRVGRAGCTCSAAAREHIWFRPLVASPIGRSIDRPRCYVSSGERRRQSGDHEVVSAYRRGG